MTLDSGSGYHWLPANEAIASRRAVRGYLDRDIPLDMVKEVLALASRSPSGSNIQPWRVRVIAGDEKKRLSAAIIDSLSEGGKEKPKADWNYYPVNWREPYIGRRRKLGWGLYGLLGIGKGDTEKAEKFRLKNYEFFGAPVGMIFTLDRDMEVGSFLDLGIFLGHLVVAVRGIGLDSCLQQSFADVHEVLCRELEIPAAERIICGMALGYADDSVPQNKLVTERVAVEEFASFSGFAAG
ncbi:MAG: nitroreductase [Burkholderiales bacterium]|nr:nitroreductase [Burkholderiales bacterium]